eukprot:6680358-Pyramimonas_sp.AAC.1
MAPLMSGIGCAAPWPKCSSRGGGSRPALGPKRLACSASAAGDRRRACPLELAAFRSEVGAVVLGQ